MVINHHYRFLYLQVPHSASTAIAAELCQVYGGESILGQHATYFDFLRRSTPAERNYRVLASIRHPMDILVTQYFKLKHNHKQRYTREAEWLSRFRIGRRQLREFAAIQHHQLSFAGFFQRFHHGVYNDFTAGLPEPLFRLIRYERLQEDFAEALGALGVTPVRPLPAINETEEREEDWATLYGEAIRPRAIRYFGPFLQKWGYAFPASWGEIHVPAFARSLFAWENGVRRLYYRARAHPAWPFKRALQPR